MKIAVISAGSLGTAMAIRLGCYGHNVSLWSRDREIVSHIKKHWQNPKYLSDFLVPDNTFVTSDLEEAVLGRQFVLFATPCQVLPAILSSFYPFAEDQKILSMIKGITKYEGKWMTPSSLIKLFLHQQRFGLLLGPGFANDIADPRNHIGLGIASCSSELRETVTEAFQDSNTRLYPSDDIAGFELTCIIKNIVAIAAGMAEKMFCDSTAALIIARGKAEMIDIVTRMGGREDTFKRGSLVEEDLGMTCYSPLSRNRLFGKILANTPESRFSEKDLDDALDMINGTVEGINSAKAIVEILDKPETEAPIVFHVYQVLMGKLSPLEAAKSLSLVRR